MSTLTPRIGTLVRRSAQAAASLVAACVVACSTSSLPVDSDGLPGYGICGNGIVERGEACDVHTNGCCNADCSGAIGADIVCREASGSCDFAESCDGSSVDCPEDAQPRCDVQDLGVVVSRTLEGTTRGRCAVLTPTCSPSAATEVSYAFSAPRDGYYRFDTFGSEYDTILYVVEGSACNGQELACNDDDPKGSDFTSAIDMPLFEGQVVQVVVDGYDMSDGPFVLNVHTQAEPVAGPCCFASPFASCNEPRISDCVCAESPRCCSELWDESCVQLVNDLGCGRCGRQHPPPPPPRPPSMPPDYNCCEQHPSPGCSDPAINQCVCEADPYCCSGQWDDACTDQARRGCDACDWLDPPPLPEEGSCCEAHETAGCEEPLTAQCVCWGDSYCCNNGWDDICVDEVQHWGCGVCPEPPRPLPAPPGACCAEQWSPSCMDEAVSACVCEADPFCCQHRWDDRCVAQVDNLGCGTCGGQPASCCQASVVAGCDDPFIQACVCDLDGPCCLEQWSEICVQHVEELGCGTCN